MRKIKIWGVDLVFIILVSMLLLPGLVQAGGFSLPEQGVREMGTAYAGSAAQARDPSTIFYNPAGLTRLKGQQAQASQKREET